MASKKAINDALREKYVGILANALTAAGEEALIFRRV